MLYHEGVLVHIRNVPVFYTPYFSHPDPSVKRKRGFLTAFPSFSLHEVSPVTKGERYSLVGWITGPAFK